MTRTGLHYDALVACLRGDAPKVKFCFASARWNWEEFFIVAGSAALLPAIHGCLSDMDLLSDVPAEIGTFLSEVDSLNAHRNEAILEEVRTVARLLNEVGIEPVLLKGAAYLMVGMYPHPAARYLVDADLLLSPEQLENAAGILMRNGFEQDEQDQFGVFRHHHPQLQREGSVPIELHHDLGLGASAALLPVSEMIRDSVSCDWNGVRVRVPSAEHLVTHLTAHSQIRHPYNERIWPPLVAMYDLVLLRRRFDKDINWNRIVKHFRDVRQKGVLVMHLLQVREVLGVKTPFPVRLRGLTYLRWLRRQILRRWPALRYIDPIYMYSTIFTRRFRVLRNALRTPGGWKIILRQLFASGIYQRFFTDIIEGRGR